MRASSPTKMKKKWVLASRKSDLARIQAYRVGEALKALDSHIQIHYQFSSSWGDRHLDVDWASVEEKGVFTQDFHKQLIEKDVDLVVHSWKDLPTELPGGTGVVATLPREDMRDVLLIPEKYVDLVKSRGVLNVLSSSPRREYNLKSLLSKVWPHELYEITFQPIRGNVPTRLHKLFKGEGHALVVAKAALDRILTAEREEFLEVRTQLKKFLKDSRWMILPLCENPCAPAQGALAIETAQNFHGKELLKELNCEATHRTVSQERQILSSYGGGCHQKIGVSLLEREYGQIQSLRGLTEGGRKLHQWGLSNKIRFAGKIHPCDPRKNKWFEREPLRRQNIPSHRPLWVVKEEALPRGSICHHLIWASGTKTWQKLARRGYWVNGSAESLGERESPRLENFSENLNWLKLTHERALNVGEKETLATYKLKPLDRKPIFTNETHFYWMSGSQFTEAIRCYPQLKKAHHSCGPRPYL